MDTAQEVALGRNGGLIWPSFIHPELQEVEPVCLRRHENASGQQEISTSFQRFEIQTDGPAELKWKGPEDSVVPFEQYNEVDRQTEHFFHHHQDSTIPRQIVFECLAEQYSSDGLDCKHAASGNQLAARQLDDNTLVVAHPSGQASEIVTLTTIKSTPGRCGFKVDVSTHHLPSPLPLPTYSHPIYQILFAAAPDSGQQAGLMLPLLAIRSLHWIKVFEIVPQAKPQLNASKSPAPNQSKPAEANGKVETKDQNSLQRANTGSDSDDVGRNKTADADMSHDIVYTQRTDDHEEVLPTGGDDQPDEVEQLSEKDLLQLSMRETASLQSKSSILNLAWSPHIADELLYVSQDGSVHLANVSASARYWPNDVRAQQVYKLQAEPSPSCSSCCWCTHPRYVYLAEGPELLRLDMRQSVQQPMCSTAHRRTADERILCFTACEEDLSMMAVCTEKYILLLDICNPSAVTLKWLINVPEALPQHLTFQTFAVSSHTSDLSRQPESEPSSSQPSQPKSNSQSRNPSEWFDECGCITASNYLRGEIHAYRFGKALSSLQLKAEPAEDSQDDLQSSQAVTSFGKAVVSKTPRHAGSVPADHTSGTALRLGDRVHALGLPQRLAYSCKKEIKTNKTLTSTPCQGNRKGIKHLPDITGMAILPVRLGSNSYDSTLLRLNPVGDLLLDPCQQFSEAWGFGANCYRTPRHLLRKQACQTEQQEEAISRRKLKSLKPRSWFEEFANKRPDFEETQQMRLWPRLMLLAAATFKHQGDEKFGEQHSETEELLASIPEILNDAKVPVTAAEVASVLMHKRAFEGHSADREGPGNNTISGFQSGAADTTKFLDGRAGLVHMKGFEKTSWSAKLGTAALWLVFQAGTSMTKSIAKTTVGKALAREARLSADLSSEQQLKFLQVKRRGPLAGSGKVSPYTLQQQEEDWFGGTVQASHSLPAVGHIAESQMYRHEDSGNAAIYAVADDETCDGDFVMGSEKAPVLRMALGIKGDEESLDRLKGLEDAWLARKRMRRKDRKDSASYSMTPDAMPESGVTGSQALRGSQLLTSQYPQLSPFPQSSQAYGSQIPFTSQGLSQSQILSQSSKEKKRKRNIQEGF